MKRANKALLRRRARDVCFAVGFGLAALIAIMGDPRWLLGVPTREAAPQLAAAVPQPSSPEAPALSAPSDGFVPIADLAAAGWADDPLDLATSTDSPRLLIPRIALQADVVEVRLTNGEWSIPRSVVGHLAETVSPGQPGNAVFAGHVIAGGRDNVFTRLHELAPGDEVSFVAEADEQRFQVTATRLVRNTDTSVLAGTSNSRVITLITCAGQWVPQENDYDQRLVVIATAREGVTH